jgi:disulfide bond formation protein DsbB
MINRKTTLGLILLFSIFALSAAYFIEYTLGHQPCNLCLIERIPYVVSIVIILLFIFIQKFEGFFFNNFKYYIHYSIHYILLSFWDRARFHKGVFSL